MLVKKDLIKTSKIESANNSRRKSAPKEQYQDPIAQPQQLLQSRSGTPDNINSYLPPAVAALRWCLDNIPISQIYRNAERNHTGYRNYLEMQQRITGQTPAILAAARLIMGGADNIGSNGITGNKGIIGNSGITGNSGDQLHIYTPSRTHGIKQQLAAYNRGRRSAAQKHGLTLAEYDRIMYPKRYRTDTSAAYITSGQAIVRPVTSAG